MFKKILKATIIAVLAVLLLSPVVYAAYTATITVVNTSSTPYTMIGANVTANVDYWSTSGYISNTGLDTRVYQGVTALPHMLTEDRIMLATNINANSSKTLTLSTGNTALSNFDIIPGYSANTSVGYVLVDNQTNLDMGNSFNATFADAWLNTTAESNKHLLYRADSIDVYVSDAVSGNVTASILGEQDYFTADTWTDVGTKITVNTTDSRINYEAERSATDDRCYKDLTSVNNSDWQINYRYRNTGAVTGVLVIGLFSATENPNGMSGDAVYVYVSGLNMSTYSVNGGAADNNTSAIATANVTDYWITLDRTANTVTLGIYSDSDRTAHISGSPKTMTVSSGVTGLRYIQVSNNNDNAGAALENVGWIDDMIIFGTNADPVKTVSLTGISSAETDLSITANTTDFVLTAGGSSASVALDDYVVFMNSNDITMMNYNSMPYANSVNLSISGSDVIYFAPNDLIEVTGNTGTLPDRSGDATDNEGTIYFGSNPTYTSLSLNEFESDYAVQTILASDVTDIAPPITVPLPVAEAAKLADMAAKDPVLYPLFNMINGLTTPGIPIMLMYEMFFLTLTIGIMFVFGKFGHLYIMVVSGLAIMGFATAWGVFDFILIILLVLLGAGFIWMQGRQGA